MDIRKWKDLDELEQDRFVLRYLKEMFGLTDQMLEHTYNGDDGPYDSGLINWRQYQEELTTKKKDKKESKTKVKEKTDAKSKIHNGHEPDTLPLFPMLDNI